MRRFDVLADWPDSASVYPPKTSTPTSPPRSTPTPPHAASALLAYASGGSEDAASTSAGCPDEATPMAAADSRPDASPNSWEMALPKGRAAAGTADSLLLHEAKRCTSCGRTGPPTIPMHDTDATYQQQPDGRTVWKDSAGRTHVRPAERHHHAVDWTDWNHGSAEPPPPTTDESDGPEEEPFPL